jgi:hypothetical protein
MRLKLTQQQIVCLLTLLKNIHVVPFESSYEKELTIGVLKRLYSKLMLKGFHDKKVNSVQLEEETICALNYVMSKVGGFEMFQPLIASELNLTFSQVNKHYVGSLRFQENLIQINHEVQI